MNDQNTPLKEKEERDRYEILQQLEDWLEGPVIVLGFVWLGLLVIELIWGLNPFLNALVYLIWFIFIVDFTIRFILAPRKLAYMRQNWLTALSLFIPALRIFRLFRVFRVLRAARAVQGIRFVRVVSSINRGMRALGNTMRRRGFGYALLLTALVLFAGAAGMFAFEQNQPGQSGFRTFGDSLWWTAMVITTFGPQYEPVTAEGRLLTLLLAIYAFAVFSYITASLASFFVGQEAEAEDSSLASESSIRALQDEISALRTQLESTRHGPGRGE